jgi:uncharacterized membrane protein
MLMRAVVAYLSAGVAFGLLDVLWLSIAALRLYRPAIGEILADEVRWVPALIFYVLYPIGVAAVVVPALRDGGRRRALWSGAVFGLVAYASYDLTNQATLRVWPTHLTLIDLAWGTFATATASVFALTVTRRTAR